MPDTSPCPGCGSKETRCAERGNALQRLLSRFWGRHAAAGLAVAALLAVLVNAFFLDAGNIDLEMGLAQAAVALLVSLAGWVLYRYGEAAKKGSGQCRCLMCGHEWRERNIDLKA